MIEPYASAVETISGKLSDLGFHLVRDTDYAVSFSNGTYSINLSTERNYHPSLIANLQDQRGKRFELGTLKEILAPERSKADHKVLRSIRDQYSLDGPIENKADWEMGIFEYVKTLLSQLLDFMLEFKVKLFTSQNGYEGVYAAKEQAALNSLLAPRPGESV